MGYSSAIINVGAAGRWQIVVSQVSQNEANNTSVVNVKGQMFNDNPTGTASNDSVNKSVSGSASWSGNGSFVVPHGESLTFIDVSFTIDHDGDGSKTVSFSATLGATGTSTFGNGGTASTSLVLDPLPRVPAQIKTPSRTFDAPATVIVDWTTPDNGGSPILEYQVQYDDSSAFGSGATVSAGTFSQKGITVPVIGKIWYFRVRARNANGYGPWSLPTSYDIPDVPGKTGTPTLEYTPPTTMVVDWTAPTDNGGATLTGYDIRYSKSSTFASGVLTATSTVSVATITDLEPGSTWYFQVRAKNSQGAGAWSTSVLYLVVCGPRVKVGGVWKNTVLYVKVAGVWKVATPYVKVSGTWKVAGG